MSAPVTDWVDVCSLADIPSQGSRIVKTPEGCLALFMETGEAQGADEGRVETKPVRIVDGRVELGLTNATDSKAA